MKTSKLCVSICALTLVVLCSWAVPATANEVINLLSGQYLGAPGSPGDPDDLITYYTENTAGAPIATVFDTEFAAALSSPPALVVAPVAFAWLPSLTLGDPDARWINVNHDPLNQDYGVPPVSALYAAPFTVSTPGTSPAILQVYYAVDDFLGDNVFYPGPNTDGLYLNGTPLPGSGGGSFATETVYSAIVSVSQGANALYLYDRDAGFGASGLIFSATITIVPEPATWVLTMAGCLGLAMWRSRK